MLEYPPWTLSCGYHIEKGGGGRNEKIWDWKTCAFNKMGLIRGVFPLLQSVPDCWPQALISKIQKWEHSRLKNSCVQQKRSYQGVSQLLQSVPDCWPQALISKIQSTLSAIRKEIGFSGTNLWKKWSICGNFTGIFVANVAEKRLVNTTNFAKVFWAKVARKCLVLRWIEEHF